jgi:hypothetical protein
MSNQTKTLGIKGHVLDPEKDGARVQLGDNEYLVVPQRIGYLRSKLGKALEGLADMNLSADNILDVLGDRAHAVLKVFIPDLMADYEFAGYATREAREAGDYNPEYDKSPSPKQIRRAFTVAAQVNEIDLLKHLGKLIGPDVIRSYLAGAMADSMTSDLVSSSATSGDTPSTSSGTKVPTSKSIED